MSFQILKKDITTFKVDAIVNAANPELKEGGGVCGAIFKAAGKGLAEACAELSPIEVGEAVITPGFKLPASHIIHTAGPIYRGGNHDEERLLKASYLSSLHLAKKAGLKSIAFPLISSGIYGYPKDEALRVAREAILEFLKQEELEVYLVVRDHEAIVPDSHLLEDLALYLSENLEDEFTIKGPVEMRSAPYIQQPEQGPYDLILDLDESFSVMLMKLIDAKHLTDVEVYKKANIDRKLFSKIRTMPGYMPSKKTAVALAIALELTLKETEDFLKRAGFALSKAVKFDVIVEYFISKGEYDLFHINEVLFYYDQPLLGS